MQEIYGHFFFLLFSVLCLDLDLEFWEIELEAPSTLAKTIFSSPFSLAEFQEFLRKDRLIVKTHLAVETL